MKLKKWMQVLLVTSSIITLAACSSARKTNNETAINDANSAYGEGAQSSGLGEESGFGDQNGGERSLSKRTYYFNYGV